MNKVISGLIAVVLTLPLLVTGTAQAQTSPAASPASAATGRDQAKVSKPAKASKAKKGPHKAKKSKKRKTARH